MTSTSDGPLFIILSFEGPDRYARAGGLAARVDGLSHALADLGFETHLFYVGDPDLPATEKLEPQGLFVHRWCQWISRHHPAGVYDGEEGKHLDWTKSLPPWLVENLIREAVGSKRRVFVLAEEWHTAASVIRLHHLLRHQGLRDHVRITWNANNVFGFDRIDWKALSVSCTLTTVSRFMKQVMARQHVDVRVLPNGIDEDWLEAGCRKSVNTLRRRMPGRIVVTKIARWDPDKRWIEAVEAISTLKRLGMRPILIARGGLEPHGAEVLAHADRLRLVVKRVDVGGHSPIEMAKRLVLAADSDVVLIDSYLSPDQCKTLYQGSHAVLANSRMEPFGLVGLEAMACGGVAIVGSSGEDYVTHGYDAISIQSADSDELVAALLRIFWNEDATRAIRRAGKATAAHYTWKSVINRVLLPYLDEAEVVELAELAATGRADASDGSESEDVPRPAIGLWRQRHPGVPITATQRPLSDSVFLRV